MVMTTPPIGARKLNMIAMIVAMQLFALVSSQGLNTTHSIKTITSIRYNDIPSTREMLRISRSTLSDSGDLSDQYIMERNFLDMSQIISSDFDPEEQDELLLQLTENDDPILFNKLHSTYDNGGYFWYGENDAQDCSFSFQKLGNRCMGSIMISEKKYDFECLVDDSDSPEVALFHEFDYSYLPVELDEFEEEEEEKELHSSTRRNLRALERSSLNGQLETPLSYEARDLQQSNDEDRIDIMCLYTVQALQSRCQSSGKKNCSESSNYLKYVDSMNEKCQLAVQQTTTAFQLSGISASVHLVHSTLVNPTYVEDQNICDIKNRMRFRSPTHPVYGEIEELRNKYKADLVGMITSNRVETCGCGSQPSNWNLDTSLHAYFTVTDECATSNLSFTHEIGHAFGCFHNSHANGHPFANGYRDGSKGFRTIMSYPCENGQRCPRVLRMSSSNNNLRYNNHPIGDSNHDNARQINLRKSKVSKYRGVAQDLTCKWNESLVEVHMRTDNNPGQISWELKKNGVTYRSKQYTKRNAFVKQQVCVKAGSCYNFVLKDTGSNGVADGGLVKVFESGNLIFLETDFTSSTQTYSIGIEGTKKHKIGYSSDIRQACQWLASVDAQKRNKECKKTYIKNVCPNVCKTCSYTIPQIATVPTPPSSQSATVPTPSTQIATVPTPSTQIATVPTVAITNPIKCKWNQSLLQIILLTDDKPNETSWELKNGQDQTIQKFRGYTQPSKLYDFQKCVKAASCYKFIISDSSGNGLSDGAYFKVVDSEQVVVENVEFRKSKKEISFGVEGTMKHRIGISRQDRHQCRWLQTQNDKKQANECKRNYIRRVCPHVCKSCV